MSEYLKHALRNEIECHEAQLWTTPHLSAIANKARELLALLEQPERDGPRQQVHTDVATGKTEVWTIVSETVVSEPEPPRAELITLLWPER